MKRTSIDEFANIRQNGKLCITLKENDELIEVKKTNGEAATTGLSKFTNKCSLSVTFLCNDEDICIQVTYFCTDDDNKDIVIITDSGMVIRLETTSISQLGRNAQGVRLINLKENQWVSSISVVEKDPEAVLPMMRTSDSSNNTARPFDEPNIILFSPFVFLTEFARQHKGLPIINLLQIEKDELVNSIIKVSNEDAAKFLLFATKRFCVL